VLKGSDGTHPCRNRRPSLLLDLGVVVREEYASSDPQCRIPTCAAVDVSKGLEKRPS
jgi:hypothetical protein